MRLTSLGNGYHATKKVFAPKDPLTKFLLEWIVSGSEVGFDEARCPMIESPSRKRSLAALATSLSSKILNSHLQHLAIVYVRQSSARCPRARKTQPGNRHAFRIPEKRVPDRY